ncbi:MAG: response regulator transcription factor [Elusimicrobiota bacterium]
MTERRILVVDDEPSWIELLKVWFEIAGIKNIEYAMTGAQALEMAVQVHPDCVVLDLVLPDQSGLEVCAKLRAMPDLCRVPVILLTAHKSERVLGLQSGADYFVGKTGQPHELLATLEAVFRRLDKEEGMLARDDLSLRSYDREVIWKGSRVTVLSPKMFVLLHVLVERCPTPVSRADLFRLVEGSEDPGASRALDVMLNRLRKALPEELADRIVNVKNFGYVYLSPQAPKA